MEDSLEDIPRATNDSVDQIIPMLSDKAKYDYVQLRGGAGSISDSNDTLPSESSLNDAGDSGIADNTPTSSEQSDAQNDNADPDTTDDVIIFSHADPDDPTTESSDFCDSPRTNSQSKSRIPSLKPPKRPVQYNKAYSLQNNGSTTESKPFGSTTPRLSKRHTIDNGDDCPPSENGCRSNSGIPTPCQDEELPSPTVRFDDPIGQYMEIPALPEEPDDGYSRNRGNQRQTGRETVTSRRRREMAHYKHNQLPSEDENDYLTPLQRKDKLIRFMKDELRRLAMLIQERDDLLEAYEEERLRDIARAVEEKDDDIRVLTEELSVLRAEHDRLHVASTTQEHQIAVLENTIKELKEAIDKKELDSQEIYLEMFRKGQKSAEFERQEEIAKLAVENPEAVSVEELLEKLHDTEDQLTFWQSLQRKESYDGAEKPETEAEVKLRFMRDSMFHFLTDRTNAAQHLRAMIGMMGFTEVQMKKINKALVEQKIAEKVDTNKDKKGNKIKDKKK